SLKLPLLYIIKGTKLAEEYLTGGFKEMTLEDYINITVSQLEMFAPETVIGRVTGDGKRDELIAPLWSLKKFVVINELDKAFIARNTWQGKLYE
nr:TIGR01212 family radical SAM protein [Clostridia bacterium]